MREYAHKDIQLMLPLRITLLVGIASIILSINLTQQYNTFIFVSCQRNMFDFVPSFLSIGLKQKDSSGYVVPNANFLLMSNGGFSCKTGAAVYGKVDGNTIYWYNNSSSADLQLNAITYEYTYIAIG